MDFEYTLLNAADRQTQPSGVPDFCDVAAKAITYKNKHADEKPPRKYSLKKRLGALGLVAALLLGVFSGAQAVERIRAYGSPYKDVYLAMKAYNTANFSMEFPLFGGAKNAAVEDGRYVNAAGDTGEGVQLTEAQASGASTGTGAKNDHSTTNTQVSGVDEGDILKNDGTYLYILSAKTGTVRVIDAAKMEQVSEIPRFKSDFYPSEIYITDTHLAVVGNVAGKEGYYEDYGVTGRYFYGDSKSAVAVYDIRDRKNPRKTGDYQQDGALLSSRMVGGAAYILSNYGVAASVSDVKVSNIEEYIPAVGPSGQQKPVAPECIDILEADPTAYTVISGVDLADPAKASTRSALGQGGVVYSSTKAVYVVSPKMNRDESEVLRFDIGGGKVEKSVSGTVPGMALNQFSLDERDGYLRIATSANGNSLYVLDGKLSVVGKVTGLAQGEQIKSVRFMGKMGYVVTFRQTDPLFAIDLGDPKKPKLLGQLKIPGFSTYMHPYDENTIIGIGFDADVNTGAPKGLKISVFDVSNPADLKETQSYVFGSGGSFYSEATSDHKAVLFSTERNLMVIPAQYTQNAYNEKVSGTQAGGLFSGAMVFDLTGRKIRLAATVTHVAEGAYPEMAHNIRRSAYIGQKLYTVSEGLLMCVSLDDYRLLGTLRLLENGGDVPVTVRPGSSGAESGAGSAP